MFSRTRINFNSIPIKITLYMIAVLLTTAALILIITNRHFNEQTKRYHEDILGRKEKSVLKSINYLLDEYPSDSINKNNIVEVLEGDILEITDIINLPIVIYDLDGNVQLSTQAEDPKYTKLPKNVMDSLAKHDYLIQSLNENGAKNSYYASFSYIKDASGSENLAIVNLPYETNDIFLNDDKFILIGSYGLAFIIILLLAAIMIYVVSNNTFKKLSLFAERIKETEVISNNIPIQYDGNDEISVLVDAYNDMLIKLKEQSELLANIERQEAWREFARQVAHEIKNPLTPMKLMIQSYMRKFNSDDEELRSRTFRTSEILMQQIDTIESIANAFSDFAKMPNRKDTNIDIVEIINNTLEIFPKDNISFTFSQPKIMMMFDKLYLNRIITNIVKNAFQAVPQDKIASIAVDVMVNGDELIILVEDNGIGIAEENLKNIFKPRFTTKNSGTGIGLSMVKKIIEDYDGVIYLESKVGVGTKFIIKLPYNKNEEQTI
jgi:two-component system, NtrC family, nitrogen regulation sensor histidine kinase NtrY